MRRDKQNLRETTAKLREELVFANRLLGGVRDGIWHRDLRTGKLWLSHSWWKSFGYTAENLPTTFEELSKFIEPKDRVRIGNAVDLHLRGETTEYDCTFRLWSHSHNAYRIIRSRGVSQPVGNGKPRYLAGTHTDITEIHHESEEIRRQFKMFELIFGSIPHLILVKNRDGVILFANEAIAKFYGAKSASAMNGTKDKDYNKNKRQVAGFLKIDRWVIDNHKSHIVQKEANNDANGAKHWLTTIKAPLINDDGSVNVVVIATFIDDVIALQSSLEASRQRARRNREMAGLAQRLSHKLGTRILTLENAIELISGVNEEEKQSVFSSIEDVKRFTEDFHKLGTANRLEFRTANLLATIKHVLSPRCGPEVEITVNGRPLRGVGTDDATYNLTADHRKLSDAFDELASNSVCWRAKPMHHISIRITRSEPQFTAVMGIAYAPAVSSQSVRNEFKIVFQDNGLGIDKKKQAKLFEPFVSGRAEGSGLGLAIVKEVIESHGGEIALTSPPGSGARFEITIPDDRS